MAARKQQPQAAERPYAEVKGIRVNPLLAEHLKPVSELVPDPENARKHPEDNLLAIQKSLQRVGFQSPVLFDPVTKQVVVGNGRLEAAKRLGWEVVPAIPFSGTKDEIRAFAIADNQTGALAEWDWSRLASSIRDLQLVDFPIEDFGFRDLSFVLDGEAPPEPLPGEKTPLEDRPQYSMKVRSPVYEPRGQNPAIADLTDGTRADALRGQILEANLEPALRDFLLQAAERHRVFKYRLIAEAYAHAPPKVKTLMEDLALVIIDYNRAIELGFVKLSEELMALVDREEEGEDED